uniref:Uncharacterized protein n=1 Tax=Odontella aurita TaxID=265563 RepID=A0A7S4MWZ5_9STRA|mmetsp:Transcript_377/g.1114  ORF Transcript_377/g.1114 Transcript_377/m.1114 type:complete len:114 (+) Transcript_377:229-570(+)|eukprot:CAMPEP_0113528538 /NCGR_PEP_ID=MMETSP0015_2-20120614/1899_1 /TAXON_ID=2838 /ORGANISM="Odontella" /LENGTH=113 /DNA_ID=CAMNT_0000427079 /DNA_START=168 /DNA_END=509 /DNA_ORIENTATION=+ /assembly_acc=CAM_ASM_000160
MKLLSASVILAAACTSSAFVVQPRQGFAPSTSTSSLQMGLFDFLSEDARKEREARKQREVEEQERLQQEIMDRRRNPEKMEEYEAKVKVRRTLRMQGRDDAADAVKIFSEDEE